MAASLADWSDHHSSSSSSSSPSSSVPSCLKGRCHNHHHRSSHKNKQSRHKLSVGHRHHRLNLHHRHLRCSRTDLPQNTNSSFTMSSSSSSPSVSPLSCQTFKQQQKQQQQHPRGSAMTWSTSFSLCVLTTISLLLTSTTPTTAFNLDSDIPVIKTGPKGSYFGFSVAQHLPAREDGQSGFTPMMLVGAPKANSTYEKMRDVLRPGALYSCQYDAKNGENCEQVDTFSQPGRRDDFTDQWLGVSLQAVDSRVITCAHRYVSIDGENRRGLGSCYTFTGLLDYDNFWEPCNGLRTDRGHKEYGLCQAGTSVAIAAGKNGEETFIFGAPGSYDWTGAVLKFSSDDKESGWYRSPVTDGRQPSSPVKLNSYLGMSVTSGYFMGDEKLIYVAGAPRSNNTGEVLLFEARVREGTKDSVLKPILQLQGEKIASSFGYQVCKGDFNADGKDDLVVGAPFFFDKKKGGAVYVYDKLSAEDKNPSRTLYGETDSRFGFAISSAGDVNLDGFEDLAIGAPYQDDGVVYLYHGSKNGIGAETTQAIVASEMNKLSSNSLSTFGYSLSGGFDLDGNSYPDLLVGAFGSDQVLLLRGKPIMNMIVEMQDMPDPIDPNGPKKCSDGRELICFSFKVCFKYTAKPKDTFNATPRLKYTLIAEKDEAGPPRVEFKKKNNKDVAGGTVERKVDLHPQRDDQFACEEETVYILPGVRDFLNPFNFHLEYELDKKSPLAARRRGRVDRSADVDDYPVLDPSGGDGGGETGLVKTFAVEFQKECSFDKICQSDLRVQAKAYEEIEPNSSGKPKGKPISQLSVGQVTKFYLHVELKNKKEPAYETNLYITVPPVLYYVQTYSEGAQYSCAPISAETVKCEIANPFPKNEVASLTMEFDPGDIDAKQNVINVHVKANTTSMEISPQNNEKDLEVKVIIKADLQLEGFVDNDAQIFYKGDVIGESAILFADQIGPVVRHNYLLSNNGPGKVSNASVRIRWPYEVMNDYPQGKHLLYLMEVPEIKGGKGKCFVDPKRVNFLNVKPAPAGSGLEDNNFVASERTLAERVRRGVPGLGAGFPTSGLDAPPLEYYGNGNPFYNDPNHKLHRRKRGHFEDNNNNNNNDDDGDSSSFSSSSFSSISSAFSAYEEQVVRAREMIDADGKKRRVVEMDCDLKTARCFEIRCEILDLAKGDDVSIGIKSRLWQSTLIEDYPKVYKVDIYSRAVVEIPAELNILQDESNDEAYAKTVAYSDIVEEEKEIPLWVIIVASLCGLFLLIIIVLVLWRCGFFRRKRPGDLHQAEKQKANKTNNGEYAEPL